MSASATPTSMPEPAWEIAELFPVQGEWTEADYFALPGRRLVEYSDGCIEVLPMPIISHQRIVRFIYDLLSAFVVSRGLGEVFFAPARLRLWPGKVREPDVMLVLKEHRDRIAREYCEVADLVVEVVSPDDPRHDLEVKRSEYAKAGIPEYWVVDPRKLEFIILKLVGDRYEEHGVFRIDQRAESALLPGLIVDVSKVFAERSA